MSTKTETENLHAYRIGFWTHRWWPTKALMVGLLTGKQPSPRADNGSRFVGRRKYVPIVVRQLKLIRRPHRPWQAEYESCRWCPRAWTKQGALRKAARDLAYQQETGMWSPWIQRKVTRRYGEGVALGPKQIADAA